MDGLTALVGLTGYSVDEPEASPEERSGDVADPRHGNVGEAAQPYSWQSLQTPGASAPKMVPDEPDFIDADAYALYGILPASQIEDSCVDDITPWTHAGGWPADPIGGASVQPDDAIRQLEMNAALRSIKVSHQHRQIYRPQANPQQDAWQEIWEVNPNSDDIPTATNQMKASLAPGGRGSTDRRQSFAKQNQYGFDSRHMHRRFAVGHIPGNFLWMLPGSRPLVKSTPGPARPPIGEFSQFAGQDVGAAFGQQGAILNNPPNAYAGPYAPYVAPQMQPVGPPEPDDFFTEYYGG